MRSVADRLSAAGYVVAAPDVFWRIAPGWERPADEAGPPTSLPLAGRLDFPQAIADCASALEHLEALPEVIGRARRDRLLPRGHAGVRRRRRRLNRRRA